MFAVIKASGKQYKARVGDYIAMDRLLGQVGDNITFQDVLLVSNASFDNAPQFQVQATIIEHMRGPKIKILKFRRRKNSIRQKGHRQDMTKIKIINIIEG